MAVVCVRACRVQTNLEIWPFFLQTQGNSGRLGENFEYFLKIRENSKLPCVMLGNGDTTLRTGGGGGAQRWTPLDRERGSKVVQNVRTSFIDDRRHIFIGENSGKKRYPLAAPLSENDMVI